MMIKQLTKEVYDLIAAGEIVLAPVSVVKELVENSLDAGADRVSVDVKAGGTERIRVTDNGSGIAREEVELAFMPHATSKLNSIDDLSSIETLGFRGEALASITAVSKVTMVTKRRDEESGSRAETEAGAGITITRTGTDTGTDVIVERLFFNVPARRKHLSGVRAEERSIIEYLSKAAVSRPDVAFRLVSDAKLVFSTSGAGDRLASIAAAYGRKSAQNLIPLGSGTESIRLDGYISGTLGLRSNRKGQHFFVNDRPVKNAVIETAVSNAYREFAEPGRFPVVFLFLTVDPSIIDVNIHPAKSEISFIDSDEISDFVEISILEVLISGQAIPRLSTHGLRRHDPVFDLEAKPLSEDKNVDTIVSTSGGKEERIDTVDINSLLSSTDLGNNINKGYNTHDLQSKDMVDDKKFQLFKENVEDHYDNALVIHDLEPLATLFATYILATAGISAYIIDQHAAHERINYERFMGAYEQGETAMQTLLTPYLFTPPAASGDLTQYVDLFERLGYEIDEFGENTWAARTFPAFFMAEEAEGFLLESIEALGEEKAGVNTAAVERIMKRACKASVKANRILSDEEIKALLRDLSECRNPYTCPHGRPVFIKLTLSDIERLFKRA